MSVYLVQVWHLHQPVTQEKRWIDVATEKAYNKLLDTYANHPTIKFNLNITGSLLENLEKYHPETIERVKGGIGRGQLRLITTGYYQPLIPLIPPSHAIAHIRKNTEALKRLFGQVPESAWVPERAWEPWEAEVWADAGVKNVLIDDHVMKRGNPDFPETAKYHVWQAEHNRKKVNVFLIDKEMRYLVPWEPVKKVIGYIRTVDKKTDGRAVVTFGDDGEKMGEWPHTEKACEWLDEFLSALEKEKFVKKVWLEDYIREVGALGKANFPPVTYIEMEKWCFGSIHNWTRHPLVKDMYSRLLEANGKGLQINDYILRAECNDPYWYARRMTYHRQLIYRNLILFDRGAWGDGVEVGDRNGDGLDEVLLSTKSQRVYVDASGRIYEWDVVDGWNLVNTGFFDAFEEEKQYMPDEGIFRKKKRNCCTDWINMDALLEPVEVVRKDGKVRFIRNLGELRVEKTYALADEVLHLGIGLKNTGRKNQKFSFREEFCFTLPTDSVERSITENHRYIFDYAGNVIEQQVCNGEDGPGVSWACCYDTVNGIVCGAAWAPGKIKKVIKEMVSEGIAFSPYYEIELKSKEEIKLDFRVYAGKGTWEKIKGVFEGILAQQP
ncbi:MAG: hypothetical protein N3F63_07130 [Thermoplasmata archaeon]|nr:hypothetical protein [Thermoplasmata archaeon]